MGLKVVDSCTAISTFNLESGMVFRVNMVKSLRNDKIGYLMITDELDSAIDLESGYLYQGLDEFSDSLTKDNLILNAKLVIDI